MKRVRRDQLKELIESLNYDSVASLEFKELKINAFLQNFKDIINISLDSLDSKNQLLNIINQIEYTISKMINIHKNIESLNQQKEFANYISKLPQIGDIDSDWKYNNIDIKKLEKTIYANIIIEKYEEVMKAFEYWSFPFFCEYTQDIDIIKNRTYDHNDLDLEKYVSTLEKIKNKVEDSNSILNSNIDNYIQYFKNYSVYQWSSKTNGDEISSLLKGNKTKLLANIDHANYDAIKFNDVDILIEIKSSSIANIHLDKLLREKFYIELTHSGLSFYKFKGKKYMLDLNYKTDEKILLRYPYGNTDIKTKNQASGKLKLNKPLLSPYTLWQIQIVPNDSVNDTNLIFKNLFSIIDKQEIIIHMMVSGEYLMDKFKQKNEFCSIEKTYNTIQIDNNF